METDPSPAVGTILVGVSGINAGITGNVVAELAVAPASFTPCTVNVYSVPLVSPVTVMGVVVPVTLMLPGFAVTINEVAPLPLGVKYTTTIPSPGAAIMLLGIKGSGIGVTALDGADDADVPK